MFPGHFPECLIVPGVLLLDFEVGTSAVRFEIRSLARKLASGRFPLPQIASA
jgi:3-hydroxymyristoyl/3-hydroxydecanoyl-(acyl carrier protein) dehydratase